MDNYYEYEDYDDFADNRCEADIKDGVCQYILNVNGTCRNVKNHTYDDEPGEIEYFSPQNSNRSLFAPQRHTGTISQASGMDLI